MGSLQKTSTIYSLEGGVSKLLISGALYKGDLVLTLYACDAVCAQICIFKGLIDSLIE